MGRVTRERPLLLRRRPPIRGRQFMLNAHEHNKSDTAGESAEAGATLQRASDSGDRRRGGDEDGTRWGSRTALSSPEVASVPPSRANAGRSPIEVKGGGGGHGAVFISDEFLLPQPSSGVQLFLCTYDETTRGLWPSPPPTPCRRRELVPASPPLTYT